MKVLRVISNVDGRIPAERLELVRAIFLDSRTDNDSLHRRLEALDIRGAWDGMASTVWRGYDEHSQGWLTVTLTGAAGALTPSGRVALNAQDEHVITCALTLAAPEYMRLAGLCPDQPRIADQFKRQATEARELAERIEAHGLVD